MNQYLRESRTPAAVKSYLKRPYQFLRSQQSVSQERFCNAQGFAGGQGQQLESAPTLQGPEDVPVHRDRQGRAPVSENRMIGRRQEVDSDALGFTRVRDRICPGRCRCWDVYAQQQLATSTSLGEPAGSGARDPSDDDRVGGAHLVFSVGWIAPFSRICSRYRLSANRRVRPSLLMGDRAESAKLGCDRRSETI